MEWPRKPSTESGTVCGTAEQSPRGREACAGGMTPLADVLLAALSEQTVALSDAAAHLDKAAAGLPHATGTTSLRTAAASADLPRSPGQIEFRFNGGAPSSGVPAVGASTGSSHATPSSGMPALGLSTGGSRAKGSRPLSWWAPSRDPEDSAESQSQIAPGVSTVDADQPGTVTGGLLARISHVGSGLRRVAQIAVDKLNPGSGRSATSSQLSDRSENAISHECSIQMHGQTAAPDKLRGLAASPRQDKSHSHGKCAAHHQTCQAADVEAESCSAPKTDMRPETNLEALGPWAAGWLCSQDKPHLASNELLLQSKARSKSNYSAPCLQASVPQLAATHEDTRSEDNARKYETPNNVQSAQDHHQHSNCPEPMAFHWEIVSSDSEDSEDSQSLDEEVKGERGRGAEAAAKGEPSSFGAACMEQASGFGLTSMRAPLPAPCFEGCGAEHEHTPWQHGVLMQSSAVPASVAFSGAAALAAPRRPGTLRSSCAHLASSVTPHGYPSDVASMDMRNFILQEVPTAAAHISPPTAPSTTLPVEMQNMIHHQFPVRASDMYPSMAPSIEEQNSKVQQFPARAANISSLTAPSLERQYLAHQQLPVRARDVYPSYAPPIQVQSGVLRQLPLRATDINPPTAPSVELRNVVQQQLPARARNISPPPHLSMEEQNILLHLPFRAEGTHPSSAPSLSMQNAVHRQLPSRATVATKHLKTQASGRKQPTRRRQRAFDVGSCERIACEGLTDIHAEELPVAQPKALRSKARKSLAKSRRCSQQQSMPCSRPGRKEIAPSFPSHLDAEFSFASDSQSSQAHTFVSAESGRVEAAGDAGGSSVCEPVVEESPQQAGPVMHDQLSWQSAKQAGPAVHDQLSWQPLWAGQMFSFVSSEHGRVEAAGDAGTSVCEPVVEESPQQAGPVVHDQLSWQPPWDGQTCCPLLEALYAAADHNRDCTFNCDAMATSTQKPLESLAASASSSAPHCENLDHGACTPEPPWAVRGSTSSSSPIRPDRHLDIRWSDPKCNEAFQSGRSARGRELWLRPGHLRSAAFSEESLRICQRPLVEPHVEPLHLEQQPIRKSSIRKKQSRTASTSRRRGKSKRGATSGPPPTAIGVESTPCNSLQGQVAQRRLRSSRKSNKIKEATGTSSGSVPCQARPAASCVGQHSTHQANLPPALCPSGARHSPPIDMAGSRSKEASSTLVNDGKIKHSDRQNVGSSACSHTQQPGSDARHLHTTVSEAIQAPLHEIEHADNAERARSAWSSNHSAASFEVSSSAGSCQPGDTARVGEHHHATHVFKLGDDADDAQDVGTVHTVEVTSDWEKVAESSEGNPFLKKGGRVKHRKQHIGLQPLSPQSNNRRSDDIHIECPSDEDSRHLKHGGKCFQKQQHDRKGSETIEEEHVPASNVNILHAHRSARARALIALKRAEASIDIQHSPTTPEDPDDIQENCTPKAAKNGRAENQDRACARAVATVSSGSDVGGKSTSQLALQSEACMEQPSKGIGIDAQRSPALSESLGQAASKGAKASDKAGVAKKGRDRVVNEVVISPGSDAGGKSKSRKIRVPDVATLRELATSRTQERAQQVNIHARQESSSSMEGLCFADTPPNGEPSGLGIAYWSSTAHGDSSDILNPLSTKDSSAQAEDAHTALRALPKKGSEATAAVKVSSSFDVPRGPKKNQVKGDSVTSVEKSADGASKFETVADVEKASSSKPSGYIDSQNGSGNSGNNIVPNVQDERAKLQPGLEQSFPINADMEKASASKASAPSNAASDMPIASGNVVVHDAKASSNAVVPNTSASGDIDAHKASAPSTVVVDNASTSKLSATSDAVVDKTGASGNIVAHQSTVPSNADVAKANLSKVSEPRNAVVNTTSASSDAVVHKTSVPSNAKVDADSAFKASMPNNAVVDNTSTPSDAAPHTVSAPSNVVKDKMSVPSNVAVDKASAPSNVAMNKGIDGPRKAVVVGSTDSLGADDSSSGSEDSEETQDEKATT